MILTTIPWLLPVLPVPQESAAVLDAPVVAISPAHRIDHLLDLDGNGRMDLAAISQTASQFNFSVSLNAGDGTFPIATGGGRGADYPKISHMETCDGNMDGVDDLLVVVRSAPSSSVRAGFMQVLAWSEGVPNFIDHLEHDTISDTVALAAVLDADRDGDADRVRVMLGFGGSVQLALDLFEQDAGGAWHATTQTLPLLGVPQAIVRLDYDGDGYTDLWLHYPGTSRVLPLAGGVLNPLLSVPHGITSDMPMAILGDVDGDADQDLAIFDMDGYVIHRRLGPASWTLEPRRSGGPAAKFADVDGDGDLDGVCCGGGSNEFERFGEPSTFRVSLNDGQGGFAPAFTFPGLGSRELAGAADLDGDGDIDLAGGQCVYYARGPLVRPPQRALPRAQSALSLVDFDRDGDADFSPGLGGFPRHLGNGRAHDFTLQCPPPPAGESDEGPGLPGDWDGDGDLDLIVRRSASGAFSQMRLLCNEGGGSYFDARSAGTDDFLPGLSVAPEHALASDLDLDGDLDLVTTHRGASNPEHWTRVWLNDGSGWFTLRMIHSGSWTLAIAPLAGSAAVDFLQLREEFSVTHMHLHQGLGTGLFALTSSFSAPLGSSLGASGVAIADFDADGDLDLAGAFQFGGSDSREGRAWFLPNSGGNFSQATAVLLERMDFGSGDGRPLARVAHAVDVDGDGRQDVVLSSPENRRAAISIVRRASDNSGWLPAVRQVVYPVDPDDATNVVVHAGTWLDLDGDGDQEYVTDAVWDGRTHGEREWGARRQDTSGSADAAGRVPVLGASGPFRPGETMLVRLTNVPSGAIGMLYIAGALPDAKALTNPLRFFPTLALTTAGPATPGSGFWVRSVAIPPSFAAADHHLRVELVDPSDATRTLRSNVLKLSFGR